ncbi:hypothetical protein SDC9_138739 [bioreactor metagenome]|uniref:Lipopolysaccharide export system permease protein LptG n=1 Tax=bioreactor metagenome TaxID=1076179 RepID=A0A645DR49_9ZZZZ
MQKIVDDSHKNAKEYKTKMQTIINNHLDYLLGTNISAEPQNNEKQINRTTNDKSANNENIQGKIKEIIVNSPRSVYDNRSQNEFDKTISEFIFSMNSLHSSILSNNEIANTYEVEIHKKYAIPFACIIFVLIGCPLGIITKGGNFGLSAAITLVFYIIYWACLIAGEKLADRLVISPFLSMWAGNIILGIAGILLTFKANNDSLSFSPIDIVNNLKQNFRLNKQRNL